MRTEHLSANLPDAPTVEVAPPAIFWRASANQYISYIGYHLATKGTRKGHRVRKVHYLGRDRRQATFDAILIDQRWDKVKADHKAMLARLSPVLGGDYRSLPLWPSKEQLAEKLAFEAIERPFEDPDAEDLMPMVRKTTLSSLKERYLKAQQQRIGLLGKRGLKPSTYRVLAQNTERSMAGVDSGRFVQDLQRDDFRAFVDSWLAPERKVKLRTAANYCKAFKQMIDWADREEVDGYRKPKIDDFFTLSMPKGHIERFDAERLKLLLANATDRCRMYFIIGLNTGYNQIDISNWLTTQIKEIDGNWFAVRGREKTSHQNDFLTQHYLWPETRALLNRHLAPANAGNYVFLNVNGRPLLNGKTDNIRDSLNSAREASGVTEITFKQLRKIGISAIKRITRNPDIARMYASQKIHGALAHYDRDDCFEPLTEALRKWGDELRAAGVI